MNLQHKHWALIFIGILVAAFIALVLWYSFGSKKALAPSDETASSTPVAATTTPSGPAHITEHAAYYDIDLTYPSRTPLSGEANARAVAAMRAKMEDTAAQFKKDGNFASLTHDDIQMMGLDQRKMALSSEYKTYAGSRTVSYVFVIYEDTLGAHPNAFYTTFTFDIKTGDQLSLGDLFSAPGYLSILSTQARSDLPGIIQKMAGSEGDSDYIKMGTEPTADNFQNFAVDGKTLRLIFSPYQVGPWALGTVIDPIPLSQLSTVLKAQYAQ
jgi:hypothetical protein